MRRVRLLALTSVVALSVAAAKAAPTVTTIAVSPVDMPDGLDNPEPVRALFDSLIGGTLQAAGFSVVASSETGAIWKRLVDSVQGYYSALTGELDEEKYTAVVRGTLHELKDRLHAQVWLRPRIEVVSVDFDDGKARWDGTDEGVGSGTSGTVPALSLAVSAMDMSGTYLYHARGGVQVLRKGMKEVSRDKLFKDSKRNVKALHLALDSLVERARRVW
jgi:hypothetical protein